MVYRLKYEEVIDFLVDNDRRDVIGGIESIIEKDASIYFTVEKWEVIILKTNFVTLQLFYGNSRKELEKVIRQELEKIEGLCEEYKNTVIEQICHLEQPEN